MKKTFWFILAFITIIIIACNNKKKDAEVNPYVGAWESISTTYLVHYLNGQKPDTTIVVPYPTTVKLLTKKHYALGRQTEKDVEVAGGGEYTYNGDTITTIRRYSSTKGAIGKPSVWKSKIEGDLWKQSNTGKNDTVQYERIETWKRIHE
jgi:hypothetical protein